MGISTRTYGNKYTYLWRQVHVLISIGYFCGLSYYTVNSMKMETYMLNKHKVTKTLSNSPWCKDTKVLAGESLCLPFSGVALRVFVSLCLIVLWLFVVDFVELKLLRFAQAQAAPPAPEACRRAHVIIFMSTLQMPIFTYDRFLRSSK